MGSHHPLLLWLGLLALCMCGLAASLVTGQRLGWIGYLLGFPVGLLGPVVTLFGAGWAFEYLRRAGPRLPPCHTGKCRGRRRPSLHNRDRGDYERVTVGDDSVLRCKCGRDYVTREAERRFLERLPDGTLKPYMVHKNFRGWFPDAGAGEQPG
ncbi:MAG: hypothetical protein PVH68_11410 [Armatimonadota bacterium]|jgi:hypothetical protein